MKTTKRLLFFAFLLSLATPFAHADKTTDLVQKTETQRVQTLLKGDFKSFARFLADDLTYTHSNGKVDSKTSLLTALQEGKLQYKSLVEEEVQARRYGGTVVLTGKANLVVASAGNELKFFARFTLVYAEIKGKWQVVAWQTTRLPEETKEER
jgi:hypothetical protein